MTRIHPPITAYGDAVLHRGPVHAPNAGQQQNNQIPGIPHGFEELLAQLNLKPNEPEPLFKFAILHDLLKEYDIAKKIYVRVTKTVFEAVVLNGVEQFHLRVLGYFINHLQGHLLVNTPTDENPLKLLHIMDVKEDTATEDVTRGVLKNLRPDNFPNHFVLYADFQIQLSSLMPKIASKETTLRLLSAYQNQQL